MLTKKIKQIYEKIGNPPVYLNISLSLLLVVLVVSYLWQINTTTQLGRELNDLQFQFRSTLEVNRELQLTVAQRQSIANLQARLTSLPLAQVNELDYIELSTIEVVAKK